MLHWSGLLVLLLVTPAVVSQENSTGSPDPCVNFECQNGGTCTAPATGPYCLCPARYTGKNCEDRITVETDLCQEHCLNGGACLLSNGAPVCQCPYGFSGSRCELSAEENHSGTCPDSQDGGVGVCGGVFCTNDSQCDSSQKCCPSSCGGQLCTRVSLTTTPGPANCNSVLCAMGMYCRVVVPCSTCQAEPRCVRSESLEKDLDSECQRKDYSQAVLIPDPRNSSAYSVLACRGSCPSESVCVYSEAGSGSCCRGYTGQVVPTEKPGVCPTGDFYVCGGIFCTFDTDCPGAQKCCPGCGHLCTDPVTDSMCGNSKCRAGYTCVQKQPYCRDDMMCTQALVPTCVPDGCAKCKYNEDCIRYNYGFECFPAGEVNPCGGCADGQICRDTGIRCVTTPCPSFECIQLNECGGCPSGQVCERSEEVCKTEPCPSFQCVEKVTPDCPLRCGSGYACELQPEKCTTNSRTPCPSQQLQPTCVPMKPGLASCPRVTSRLSSSPLCWIQEKRIVKECASDKECKAENSRCCTTACSKKACITVNKRVLGDD